MQFKLATTMGLVALFALLVSEASALCCSYQNGW